MVIFSAGVLAIAGAVSHAVEVLRQAESRDGARVALASIVDSLTQFASPGPGSAVRGRYRVAWTVADSGTAALVRVSIRWQDGTRPRADSIEVNAAVVPRRLHVVP